MLCEAIDRVARLLQRRESRDDWTSEHNEGRHRAGNAFRHGTLDDNHATRRARQSPLDRRQKPHLAFAKELLCVRQGHHRKRTAQARCHLVLKLKNVVQRAIDTNARMLERPPPVTGTSASAHSTSGLDRSPIEINARGGVS